MSTWTQTDNASDYAHKLTASMLHPGYHACIIPNICIVCSLLFNDKDLPIRVNLITWFHSSWPEVQTPHCTAEIFHLSTTIVDAALKPHLSSVLTPHQPQRPPAILIRHSPHSALYKLLWMNEWNHCLPWHVCTALVSCFVSPSASRLVSPAHPATLDKLPLLHPVLNTTQIKKHYSKVKLS